MKKIFILAVLFLLLFKGMLFAQNALPIFLTPVTDVIEVTEDTPGLFDVIICYDRNADMVDIHTTVRAQDQLNTVFDNISVNAELTERYYPSGDEVQTVNGRICYRYFFNYSTKAHLYHLQNQTENIVIETDDKTDPLNPRNAIGIYPFHVNAQNDAPILNNAQVLQMPQLVKNNVNSPGVTIQNILPRNNVFEYDDRVPDFDPRSMAIISVDDQNGRWEYTIDGIFWHPINDGALSSTRALLLKEADTIRFVPKTNYVGQAILTYRVWDESDGRNSGSYADTTVNGGITSFSAQIGTVSISVVAVNHAPVLANADHRMTTIFANTDGKPGDTVTDIVIDGSITDQTEGGLPAKESIAIGAVDNTNGKWFYQKVGSQNRTEIKTVTWDQAILLKPLDVISFEPSYTYTGSATFQFRAWDETAYLDNYNNNNTVDVTVALGPNSSFSDQTGIVTINVINAPDINFDPDNSGGKSPAFETGFTEGGPPVNITDTDATIKVNETYMSALSLKINDYEKGQDVLSADTTSTSINAIWDAQTGTLSLSGRDTVKNYQSVLRSVKYANVSNYPLDDERTILIIGNRMGVVTTVKIEGVNDPPVIHVPGAITSDENTPITFSPNNFNAITVSDPDAGTGKLWIEMRVEYGEIFIQGGRRAGENMWIGTSGTIDELNNTILNGLVYMPKTYWVGQDMLSLKVSDNGLNGSGGELNAANSIIITIVDQPNAPELKPDATYTLTSVGKDVQSPDGDRVGDILDRAGDGAYTDPDPGATRGIAVVGVDNNYGVWQYSVDGGASWTAFGTTSAQSAVLLDENAAVRFIPDKAWQGSSSISFKAWDGSQGRSSGTTGVNTSFSDLKGAFGDTVVTAKIDVVSSPSNTLVADAGPEQKVRINDTVYLNGSNSTDSKWGIRSYFWTQTDPTAADDQLLSGDQRVLPRPELKKPGNVGDFGRAYTFLLQVTNNNGEIAEDYCVVNYFTHMNEAPTANAGADQNVFEGQSFTLNGKNSTDDEYIASYSWSEPGKNNSISALGGDPSSWSPQLTAPYLTDRSQSRTFQLTVTDNRGLISTDTCIVNIIKDLNDVPVANAGGGRIVKEGDTVELDATGSFDRYSGIKKYLWTQISGDPVTITSPLSPVTTFIAPPIVSGDSVKIALEVENGFGLRDRDTIEIIVQENNITHENFPENAVAFMTFNKKAMAVNVLEGGDLVALNSSDPSGITDNRNRPLNMIYGVLDFQIKTHKAGIPVKVMFYLPDPAPTAFNWYKYSRANGWYDYAEHAEFSLDRTRVTITLIDGGAGDEDGMINGIIKDPSSLGEPSGNQGSTGDGSSGGSSQPPSSDGGGGCFIESIF